MKECDIPLSPNWFLSSVSSGNSLGLYAFGGRQDVFVYDVSQATPESLPKLVCVYSEHKELISAIGLSPDPDQLMCCSADNKNVKLWDVRSSITIQCHSQHTEQITCLTWSPKNTDIILTASEKGNIVLWRLKDNTVSSYQLERDYIIAMKASPHHAHTVLIGYKKGLAVVADFSGEQPRAIQKFSCNDGEITSVCWCPRLGENFLKDDDDSKGSLLATVGRKFIKVWGSSTGRQICYKELQRTYSSSEVPDFMSKKAWIDLHWPSSQPDKIVYSSLNGDLNVWNLRLKPSQKPQQFSYKKLTPHHKKIFNVVATGENRLVSFSLDRVICVWDVGSLSAVCSMPTFGGHVFCARASPLDPGYVAFGSGANTITVWNQGSKYSMGDVTSLNYGTRSKITCVAWHPEKEGLLAFGSEDGRVGVCNVLTKRHPILSNTFHRKTVYVVCWAHPLKNNKEEDRLTVYSVGDGNVLQHFMGNEEHRKEAVDVMECLKEVNGDRIEESPKSELMWFHDFTRFAIGSANGVVEIYNFPDLRIVGSIHCQTKLVNCIRWHPQATEETNHTSAYRNWIALAGNDNYISIHDLSPLDGNLDPSQPLLLTQPLRMLKGHSKRITDICWAIHKDAHLVSVSFDGSAIVWNAKTAEALVCYREHTDRLLTTLWSSIDPDLIITAGSDTLMRMWRLSEQPPADLSTDKKPKKKKVASNPLTATPHTSTETGSSGDAPGFDFGELTELKDLLEMKKRQLLMQVDALDSRRDVEGGDEVRRVTNTDPNGAAGSRAVVTISSSAHHHHQHINNDKNLANLNDDDSNTLLSASRSSLPSSSSSSSSSFITRTRRSPNDPADNQKEGGGGGREEEEEEEEEEGKMEKVAGTGWPKTDARKKISVSKISVVTNPGNNNNNNKTYHDESRRDGAATVTVNVVGSGVGCSSGDCSNSNVKAALLAQGVRGVVSGTRRNPAAAGRRYDEEGIDDDEEEEDFDDGEEDFEDRLLVTVEDLVPPVKAFLPNRYLPSSASSLLSSKSSWSSSSSAKPGGYKPSNSTHNPDIQEGGSKKRKTKTRSFFPVLSKEANKGKASLQEDLLDLTAAITGQGDNSDLIDKKPHLGLYTDRLGTHRCLLQESESHLSHENMEYHLQVELWRGNVAGALQIARQRNELSDWIIAMAPLASHDLWEVVCVEYAEHLEEEGQYHKAASYLLAGHRVHQAIELFRNHKLYKEAVSLARIRLSPVDPILEDLYTEWGQSLMKEGQFEQAAKCYLAMRQIQEASKMLTRRNDQSSLRTTAKINLLAREEPAGTEYAFKLFSQYLVAGNWVEAYGFVKEHTSLKPFLPLLCSHELLVEQLHALCPPGTSLTTQKPLDSSTNSFRQWGSKDGMSCKNRIHLPDFLVNKLDTDPVVPWDPLLIEGHTFPHHVLRNWYYRLNMDLLPTELKASYGVIYQLLEYQKSFADIPQTMIVLSTHLTLCFISLLLSETSTAISHLLQATAFLHQNESRGNLLGCFCQLVLPQGPKYLLKLQQEFNASRLVISLESPGGGLEQAGGEGHSTIKKYLSDIKDNDRGISSAGSRCRELDCLRSFYYLAVLEYLNEEFLRVRQHGEDDGVPPHKDKTIKEIETDAVKKGTELIQSCDKNKSNEVCKSNTVAIGNMPGSPPSTCSSPVKSPSLSEHVMDESSSFSSPVDPSDHKSLSATTPHSPTESSSTSITEISSTSPSRRAQLNHTQIKTETSDSSKSPTLPSSSSSLTSLSGNAKGDNKSKSSLSSASPHKGKLDHKNLLHISKGILWDVQAKREALTETLGYIHRAISQHLLTNRSELSSSSLTSTTTQQRGSISAAAVAASVESNTQNSTSADEDGSCHSSRLSLSSTATSSSSTSTSTMPSSSFSSSLSSSTMVVSNSSPLASSSTQQSNGSTINGNKPNTITTHIPPSSTSSSSSRPISQEMNNVNGSSKKTAPSIHRSISETVSSRKVSETTTVLTDVFEVRQKVEQELLGIIPTSPSMASHKSKKVFWRDSKESDSPGYGEDALVKRNPEGTEIPLEWDNLPVDLKYTQPYVSQALLRQEQETIAAELKQVPDGSKVPFPSIPQCTKTLLDACVSSTDLSVDEKRAYLKHLKDWSVLFAVTSYGQDRVEKDFSAAHQQQQQ